MDARNAHLFLGNVFNITAVAKFPLLGKPLNHTLDAPRAVRTYQNADGRSNRKLP